MKRIIIATLAALAAFTVCVGFTQADASQGRDSETTFEISPNDITNWAAIDRMDHEKAKLHAAQAIDSWQRMIAAEQEAEEPEEYYDEWFEPEYYEPVYYEPSYSYSGGSTATTLGDLLNGQGRAYDEIGRSYTYYGDVIGHLDIPGENVDEHGVIHDGDGYIVVAADSYERGAIIETPYGDAKNYDSGGGYGNVDIYTNR